MLTVRTFLVAVAGLHPDVSDSSGAWVLKQGEGSVPLWHFATAPDRDSSGGTARRRTQCASPPGVAVPTAYHGGVIYERISIDHQIMGGVPCIRGTRIPVTSAVGMVADGMTVNEIVAEFPQLTLPDIQDALRYAAAAVDEREIPLATTG